MLQHEYLLENIGFDTAENEPRQVFCMIGAREPWFGIVPGLGKKENEDYIKKKGDLEHALVNLGKAIDTLTKGTTFEKSQGQNLDWMQNLKQRYLKQHDKMNKIR